MSARHPVELAVQLPDIAPAAYEERAWPAIGLTVQPGDTLRRCPPAAS